MGLSETFGLLPAPLPPPLIVETKSIAAALGPCRAARACLSARGAGRAKKRAPEGSSDSSRKRVPAAGRAVVGLAGEAESEAKVEREEKSARTDGCACMAAAAQRARWRASRALRDAQLTAPRAQHSSRCLPENERRR